LEIRGGTFIAKPKRKSLGAVAICLSNTVIARFGKG